jgi:hypothetical protein
VNFSECSLYGRSIRNNVKLFRKLQVLSRTQHDINNITRLSFQKYDRFEKTPAKRMRGGCMQLHMLMIDGPSALKYCGIQ